MPIRFIALVIALLAGPFAMATNVVKIGKTPDIVFTTRPPDKPWQKGDPVCLHRGKQTIGCGIVMATNANHAAIKMEPGGNAAAIADEVRLSGRNVANRVEGSSSRSGLDDYSKAQVSLELAGASLIYSVFGSYRLSKRFALNLGFSYLSATSSSTGSVPGVSTTSVSLLQVPASISWLASGEENSFLEILAGVDAVFAGGGVSFAGVSTSSASSSAFLPELGVGYRYWPKDGGFHFRATAYVIYSPGASSSSSTTSSGSTIKPWAGLTLGYAF